MFKHAIIHYPKDTHMLKQIHKNLAVFRCIAIARYVESLKLSDKQKEVLFDELLEELSRNEETVSHRTI